MDLRTVKYASSAELAGSAVAAAGNAQGLLDDAGLLAEAGREARACSLAVLSIEESAKSVHLAVLAAIPGRLRARAPLRRLLAVHALKLVGGLLLSVLPFGEIAARLSDMTSAELERTLEVLVPADHADLLRRRGLYVDMEADGITHGPEEITSTDAKEQLGRAEAAVASLTVILGPQFPAWLKNPPQAGLRLAEDVFSALIAADPIESPKAATAVIMQAVVQFRDC
jgi:AbiV family abortive infection protein